MPKGGEFIKMYIAEKTIEPIIKDEFELYETKDVETVDGTIVEVKSSIGRFRLDQLEEQKANLTEQYNSQLVEVNDKIKAISDLIAIK